MNLDSTIIQGVSPRRTHQTGGTCCRCGACYVCDPGEYG